MIQHYPFEVLPLPYLYDSLEPNINMETMFFHHSKHLAAYVDNLNALLRPYPQFHEWTLERLLLENQELLEQCRGRLQPSALLCRNVAKSHSALRQAKGRSVVGFRNLGKLL